MPRAISMSTCCFVLATDASNKGTWPRLFLIVSTPALVRISLGCSLDCNSSGIISIINAISVAFILFNFMRTPDNRFYKYWGPAYFIRVTQKIILLGAQPLKVNFQGSAINRHGFYRDDCTAMLNHHRCQSIGNTTGGFHILPLES